MTNHQLLNSCKIPKFRFSFCSSIRECGNHQYRPNIQVLLPSLCSSFFGLIWLNYARFTVRKYLYLTLRHTYRDQYNKFYWCHFKTQLKSGAPQRTAGWPLCWNVTSSVLLQHVLWEWPKRMQNLYMCCCVRLIHEWHGN